jgi:hypothetical protein
LERTYFIHKNHGDFRKVIMTIKDCNNHTSDLLLVQYYFTGSEHPILKLPHGNSKSSSPYKRTKHSVLQRMKEICKDKDPVATMEVIDSEAGDVVGQSSAGSRLRNVRQVTNAKRKLKLDSGGKCELADTMEKCKTVVGPDGVTFVRCVVSAPEPMCILGTNRQLQEMVRNCTDSSVFVPIGVDPTFKLGNFYVTPVVFPLRMLISKETGKSPIYLGPMLIHQSQKYSAYYYLASQLVGLNSNLKNIRAIGTDGESALYSALTTVFPHAVHLRCFNHFKKNIENKLQSIHLPTPFIKEILHDIFGVRLESERQLGLVDTQDEIDFLEKLEILKEKWDKLERDNKLTEQGKLTKVEFHEWFVKEKADVVIQCMIKDVRRKAGMGCDPDHFFTNMCEAMNKTLKQRTQYKQNDVGPFIEKMYELVEAQEKLLRKAVIRCDRWRFRDEYAHLEVDQDKWFTMNVKSQKYHLDKVYSEALAISPPSSDVECISYPSTSGVDLRSQLSVNGKELINNYRISSSTLSDIWMKASQLMATPDLIALVPGQDGELGNRMVASINGGEPHYVSRKSNGQYVCNGSCSRFVTYKICQHAVAAAEHSGKLSAFCQLWKTLRQHTPNLDKLAMSGLPKGVAGQKGGVPKGGRRGKRGNSTLPTTVTDRITVLPRAAVNTDNNSVEVVQSTVTSQVYHSQSLTSPIRPQLQSVMQADIRSVQSFQNQPSISYSPHGIQQYNLKMLTKQIKVCSGCRLGYNNQLSIPEPPYNMCIPHEESFQVSPRSAASFSTPTIVHYHAYPDCIWKKNPSFLPTSLNIPSSVLPKLAEANKVYLAQYFGINI